MSQNNVTPINPTVWEYNGHTFDFDMEDQDMIEKFENAVDILDAREKALPKDGKLSAINGAYCDAYYEFFDNVLGAGSAMKLFEGKKNSRVCDEVYFNSFIPFIRNQTVIRKQRSADYAGRTATQQNRSQRRKRRRDFRN